jgi:hypothetical protein
MEARLQFHALGSLFPEKEHPVDTYKAGWVPNTIWIFWGGTWMKVRLQFYTLAALFTEKEHPVDTY